MVSSKDHDIFFELWSLETERFITSIAPILKEALSLSKDKVTPSSDCIKLETSVQDERRLKTAAVIKTFSPKKRILFIVYNSSK